MTKPVLCLDFDGVLHGYQSGWKGPGIIVDPPVPGAIEFLNRAMETFAVVIHSSRFNRGTINEAPFLAVVDWLKANGATFRVWESFGVWPDPFYGCSSDGIILSSVKPPAYVTIDDRAIQFRGEWPSIGELAAFRPWKAARLP